jgi:enamine deaminase RidA (YjgF/YER057c/UK114 family)
MQHEVISSKSAPAAVGHYSHAIKLGNTLFLSGQVPLDAQTMVCKIDSNVVNNTTTNTITLEISRRRY